ncbi:MAG: hypothetical protein GY829_05575 [Gammaproteobacteria bacterium]|nr:hypothetical protein [Gammaproteobacteria bacterium]
MTNAAPIELTQKQANFIAMKVWQNEGAGLDKYLVHWNDGEDFASVGIGHFIWFSKGHTEKFRETFPMVIAFMEAKNVAMPEWLNSSTPLPWNSKTEFYAAKNLNSKKYLELFEFLKTTKVYQAEFLAQRLNKALPQILRTIDNLKEKKLIEQRFNNILYNTDGSSNERGIYVLLDYINFKGEGTVISERYNSQGWGLLQVLTNLDPNEENRFKAFAKSAEAMLSRRIKNSPPERGEERWRKNWTNRVNGYWK